MSRCGRRGCWTCWRRSAGTDIEQLPARLVERAQGFHGGPLVDDVAILLLSADAAPSDAAPSDAALVPSAGSVTGVRGHR